MINDKIVPIKAPSCLQIIKVYDCYLCEKKRHKKVTKKVYWKIEGSKSLFFWKNFTAFLTLFYFESTKVK